VGREMGRAAVVGCRQHGALVLGERSRLYAGGRACVNSEMCVSCLSRVCVCVCVYCVKCVGAGAAAAVGVAGAGGGGFHQHRPSVALGRRVLHLPLKINY